MFTLDQVHADDDHRLAVEWQRSEETISGSNRSTEIEPHILNIHYGYRINDVWSIALSGWDGDAGKSWNDTFFLVNEQQGVGATLSFQQETWWLDISLNSSTSDTRLQVKNSDKQYSEKTDTWDLSVHYHYDWSWYDCWITPGIGIGYQRGQFESHSRNLPNLTASGWRISASEEQDQEGSYISGQLSISYPLAISAELLFLPSLSAGWQEPFWGQVSSSSTLVGTKNTKVRHQSTSQDLNEESEGSGIISIAFGVLIDHYSVDLSMTEPLDNPQLGIGIGISF